MPETLIFNDRGCMNCAKVDNDPDMENAGA